MTIEILRSVDVSAAPMVRRARAAVEAALGEPVPPCTVLLGSRSLAAAIFSPNYRTFAGAREWLRTWWDGRGCYGQTFTCAGGDDPLVMVHTTSRRHLWPTVVHELVHVVQAARPGARDGAGERRDDTLDADEDEAYRIERLITSGAACPRCGSTDNDSDTELHRPWVIVTTCRDCGNHWKDLA